MTTSTPAVRRRLDYHLQRILMGLAISLVMIGCSDSPEPTQSSTQPAGGGPAPSHSSPANVPSNDSPAADVTSLQAPFSPEQAATVQQYWADELGVAVNAANSIGMEMTIIPPGTFVRGSPESEPMREENERQQQVTISQPFAIGRYEVTQGQWSQISGANPSYFSTTGFGAMKVADQDTSTFPVETVNWYESVQACNKLSESEGLPPYYDIQNVEVVYGHIEKADVTVLGGIGYRHPTEAEWEYACRAGTNSAYSFGDQPDLSLLNSKPTEGEGGLGRTTTVGSYPANAFGLYDMHGNVSELCYDFFDYYAAEPVVDPAGGTEGAMIVRGGHYLSRGGCRSAFRGMTDRGGVRDTEGLRLARSLVSAE